MMHSRIEQEEIVERYARKQLTPEDQQAFEEHFFGCDECFKKLQETERFIAGIRNAADRGLLNDKSPAAFASGRRTWFVWALAATTCAAVVLAAAIGLTSRAQMSRLRAVLDRTSVQLQEERRARTELEQRAGLVEQAEANVPLVMLHASRAEEEPASVLLQPGAKQLVLWIEPGPSRYREFRLEVFSSGNTLVTSVDHLKRGPYAALAASLPADRLPAGDFRITLAGQNPPPAALAGEYHLRIRRP
jgi:hypothetical protein